MDNQFSTQALIKSGSEATGLNPAKIGRYSLIGATLLALGFVAWKWVLPAMVDIVWDLAQILVIGIPSLLLLGFIVSQRRNIFSFYDILVNMVAGKQIQMAPFRMQERKVELAEQNARQVEQQYGKLKGAFDRVSKEYDSQVGKYKIAEKAEGLAQTPDEKYQQQKNQQRAAGFIAILKPQYENMAELCGVVESGLKKMKQMILDVKTDLAESKIVFDVVMTGKDAMEHMQKAMVGDAQVNSDSERATVALMQRISLAVGQTQAAMQIVTEITRSSNLEDAAKLAVARDQLKQLGTSDITMIPAQQGSLQYQGMTKAINTTYPVD